MLFRGHCEKDAWGRGGALLTLADAWRYRGLLGQVAFRHLKFVLLLLNLLQESLRECTEGTRLPRELVRFLDRFLK